MERGPMLQDKAQTEAEAGKAGSPEEQLIEAKLRFLDNARNMDPLGIVKRNPFKSLGCAFCLGVGMQLMAGKMKNLPLISLLWESGNLIGKYALSKYTKRP